MQSRPQRGYVPQPGTETPTLALEVRRDVRRHHRPFDKKGADAAHGICQRATSSGDTWPAGTHQDRGSKVFLERRCTLLQSIATLVQAVPGEVERKHRLPLVEA